MEGQVRKAPGEVDVDRGVLTTQMLRGRTVVGGGVASTASAMVRSSPWEDAPKMVVPVWCSTWRPSACRVMRTEAQPPVGVRCWVPDASVK